MGLFKPIGLEISGYNITLDTNIDVFVGDSLKLVFQIKSWDIIEVTPPIQMLC